MSAPWKVSKASSAWGTGTEWWADPPHIELWNRLAAGPHPDVAGFDTWPEALCYALARAEGFDRPAALGKAWGRKGRAA